MQKEVKPVFKIAIVIEKDTKGFHAFCPTFRGLHVGGDTEAEALENAKDAAVAYLSSLIKHKEPISICDEIKPEPPRRSLFPRRRQPKYRITHAITASV